MHLDFCFRFCLLAISWRICGCISACLCMITITLAGCGWWWTREFNIMSSCHCTLLPFTLLSLLSHPLGMEMLLDLPRRSTYSRCLLKWWVLDFLVTWLGLSKTWSKASDKRTKTQSSRSLSICGWFSWTEPGPLSSCQEWSFRG